MNKSLRFEEQQKHQWKGTLIYTNTEELLQLKRTNLQGRKERARTWLVYYLYLYKIFTLVKGKYQGYNREMVKWWIIYRIKYKLKQGVSILHLLTTKVVVTATSARSLPWNLHISVIWGGGWALRLERWLCN